MIKKTTLMLMMLITAFSFSQTQTLDISISSSSDDAEEEVATGIMDLTSTDIELCDDGGNQFSGLRFQNVTIPQGSTITTAYIQFTTDETDTGSVTVNIVGIDADDITTFTTANDNISDRIDGDVSNGTTATTSWSPAAWNTVGESGTNQRTPSLNTIITEIISRGGWNSGNSMGFVFSQDSGSIERTAESYNGSSSDAAVLHVEYTLPPNEIDVKGNGNSIADGDNTPSATDNTQFGNVGIGQTTTKTFSITNQGGSDLDLSGSPIVDITGDSQFTVTTQPSTSTLSGSESVDFIVEFAPSASATYNATLSIANDDSNENPYTFDIQGTGAIALVDLDILGNGNSISNGDDTPSLSDDTDFGSLYSFIERTRTFTIDNTGNSILTISSVTSSNADYTISSIPAASVAIGASTTFDVTFNPSSVATISSTITINSNDPDENPFTFDVEGQSTNPPTFPASISAGDDWFYLDDGSNQGTVWRALSYDQENWTEAATEIGYGDGDETTDIGQPAEPRPITTYFRKYLNIADASIFNSIDLEAVRDDGIIVYINNIEVWRDNLPTTGPIEYDDEAPTIISSAGESAWITQSVASTVLVDGVNIITAEIHQRDNTSSDISFNFKLTPSATALPSAVVDRGPYLQTGTPTSVIVKWRTETPTESVVNYGTSLVSLSMDETSATLTTEHEVALTGLTPNTKYYFNIANLTEVLKESATGDMYVITSPTAGTKQFVRAWILGDPGTANTNQRNVRDAYYTYVDGAATNTGKTDMMLFLGDNAYNSGTQTEYQNAFFNIYDDMLQKSVAWSCLGNHDGYSADSNTQTGPYYDIFTFPTTAEAGGTASGTEAYYSFDYGNIHFIILDSYDTSRSVGGTMYNWAQTDIQNTTQDWIVVMFHHPPYTKGSHNSDTESQLIEMRQNFMPMLESNGVDLILNGHSHSYERSYFLNGHHGLSNTFNSGTHTVGATGPGDGKPSSDGGNGVYSKTNLDTDGAVYITTGSAGKVTGSLTQHNAIYSYLYELGSCVMEVEDDGSGGQNLTVKFLRETGAIDDYFIINKTGLTLSEDKNETVTKTISVHPVPTKDILNIGIATNENFKNAKFYDALGQLVKESTHQTINVSKLKPGMYIVEIATDNKTYFKSILKE